MVSRLSGKLCVLFFMLCVSRAMSFDIKKPESRGAILGYGYGDPFRTKGEYVHHTIAIDFTYPLAEQGALKDIRFQLEPFASLVSSPDTGGEAGCVFFFKYMPAWNFPLKPYVRGGSGVIFISQVSDEQSSGFNFASQFGFGISLELSRIIISAEYRTRHVSNWFLGAPNGGIDTRIWLLGLESPL